MHLRDAYRLHVVSAGENTERKPEGQRLGPYVSKQGALLVDQRLNDQATELSLRAMTTLTELA